MYSSSTTEGSIGKARKDLDRCAHILNEVLDNGSGILGTGNQLSSPDLTRLNLMVFMLISVTWCYSEV